MKNKQLTIGALLSYAAIIFNIASGLLYTPWMIHTIGDDQYALYTLAISVINMFMLDFGIGSAVTKFLSNYNARGLHSEADRFMGIVYKVYFLVSAVIAFCLVVFFFFIESIYINLTTDELVVFKHLFIIAATFSVLSFPFTTFNGVLIANERFIEVKACNLGQKVLNVFLIVLALMGNLGVYSLVIFHSISNVVFIFVKYICIRKNTNVSADFKYFDKSIAKNLFGYSSGITVINLAQRCIFNIMPTMIAALIGSAEVTVFSLAVSLEGYVFTFADAINGMFMPRISHILVHEHAKEKLSTLMVNVGRFHVMTIGLIYVGFLVLGKEFISIWMGTEYNKVYVCALLIIFPSLIDVPQQIAKTSLLAKDHVKEQAVIYVCMAVINVILSLVLIPLTGLVGAALSICVSYLLRTMAFNFLYKRTLEFDLKRFFFNVYGRWGIIAGITVVFGVGIKKLISVSGWIGLLLKIMMIITVYIIMFILIGLKKDERTYLLKLFKNRGNE